MITPIHRNALLQAACLVACIARGAWAEDWPTYQHDNQRSGISSEQLRFPLKEAWRHTARHAPRPAWPLPAKANLWANVRDIKPAVTHDRAFHVAVAGDLVYFGSSATDAVYALNAATGEVRWRFFAGGPVRLAPAVWEGKVFVGSDDGRVYCLDAADGTLVWDYAPRPGVRMIPGNGRMISACPVRTGLAVDGGVAYFCAGMFADEGVYLCALNAEDGSEVWTAAPGSVSPRGYVMASPKRLYVPNGRTAPFVFDRANGRLLRSFEGVGGTYALLANDALVYGPGVSGQLRVSADNGEDRVVAFAGNRIVATPGVCYLQRESELVALDRVRYLELEQRRGRLLARRKKAARGTEAAGALAEKLRELEEALAQCHAWKRKCEHSDALILAGETLFAGGDGEVAAYKRATGKRVWHADVDGRAYGLAVAGGRLFVSTDKGAIHCFAWRPAHSIAGATSTVSAEPGALSAALAQRIVEETGAGKGYCLLLGCGDGGLAREIARHTELSIVAIERDPEAVSAAREALDAAGLHGVRVAVSPWRGSGEKLPYTGYFANLAVCADGPPDVSADEVFRVLRPCGGVAYIAGDGDGLRRWVDEVDEVEWTVGEGRAIATRDALPGSGDWTHMYADATNSACSYDRRVAGPMRLQWFGGPGPRPMIDRHHRNVAPLCRDGRLFVIGDNCLMGMDAYNGVMLWNVELPNSRRLGAPFDTCNAAVADDGCVHIAVEDACRVFDGATGRQVRAIDVPQLIEGQLHYWGYTAIEGGSLFGSGREPDAVYNRVSYFADAYQWGDHRRMVTSNYLFCLDRANGAVRWTYKNRVIINPAIAMGGGRIYFVESRNPKAVDTLHGKMAVRDLLKDGADLVALDAATGNVLWRQSPDLTAFEHVVFLSYGGDPSANETLLASGTMNAGQLLLHVLRAFDAATGQPLWGQDQDTGMPTRGGHGEQTKHPAIIGGTVYAEPYAYDLRTGERVLANGTDEAWVLDREGGGCGTISASASALLFRGSNPKLYDLGEHVLHRLNDVSRTGCWINMIPAAGLVLIPEASSGCTCPYPIQTSFAYVPAGQEGE